MEKYQYEEITMALSIIIALLAFQNDIQWLGYTFAIKGGYDAYCAIMEALISVRKENEERKENEQR